MFDCPNPTITPIGAEELAPTFPTPCWPTLEVSMGCANDGFPPWLIMSVIR